MNIYISLISMLLVAAFSSSGCEKKLNSGLNCNPITLNQTFNAKIGEEWCIETSDWKITFGPLIEDSRCNVVDVQCIWAGRYVMAATIDDGEIVQDTFNAETNWQDTLYQGGYRIILAKVYPEVRTSMEALDPSKYSFDVIVK